jgi:hypothetical protein
VARSQTGKRARRLRREKRPLAVIAAAASLVLAAGALTGCASGTSAAGGSVPYPKGTWSASDQGTFMAACHANGDAIYCACALGDVMQRYPRASTLPGSIRSRGTRAGADQQDFPDCAEQ